MYLQREKANKNTEAPKGVALQRKHQVSARGGVAQLQTSMDAVRTKNYKYDSDTKSETAGKHAEAYLDPSSPAMGTSPSSSALKGVMGDLKSLGYQYMKKGHLINEQVGGPGVAANLFPITTSANDKHKRYVENYVKRAMTYNMPVYYSVEVTEADYSTSDPDAKFTCELYPWDKSQGAKPSAVDTSNPIVKPTDIDSSPQIGSTGFGSVYGLTSGIDAFGGSFSYSSNNPKSISYKNSSLPTGFGGGGSGKGRGMDWSHTTNMDL
ncbi:MAG: DNA/RNA non-specific endonuclease [Fluviicola sp.]